MPELNPISFSQRKMCSGWCLQKQESEATLTEAGLGPSAHP